MLLHLHARDPKRAPTDAINPVLVARLGIALRGGVIGQHAWFWSRKRGFESFPRNCASYSSDARGTLPASAPGSIAGPRGEAMPSTRIAFRPRPSFSRPSVEETSWPQSSLTRSSR